MSDRNFPSPSSPRDTERYAELSDLLGDIAREVPASPRNAIFSAEESASLESALASVDASYPIRPREVPISGSAAARSWQAQPGSFSRATPVAAPLAPRAIDAWDLRPTLNPDLRTAEQAFFPDAEKPVEPMTSVAEPEFMAQPSDEEMFQSVLDGLEGDLINDAELATYAEPIPQAAAADLSPQAQSAKDAADFYDYMAAGQNPVVEVAAANSTLPDLSVAEEFDPVSEFDAVFNESGLAELPVEDLPHSGAQYQTASVENETLFEDANFEDLEAQLSDLNESKEVSSQDVLGEEVLPTNPGVFSEGTVLAAGAAILAARANSSREIPAESATLPVSTSISGKPAAVFVDSVEPYSEVPVTGSLQVPEFASQEVNAPQRAPDYDDFDMGDFTPAPVVAQHEPAPAHIVVHEQPQKPAPNSNFDDLADVDFDDVFQDGFDPTDELASIIDPNAKNDPLGSTSRDDEFVPMPALPPVEAARSSRSKWWMIGGLAVALIGALAIYGSLGDGATDGQAPALVRADNEPVRVAPDNPGGTVVPNQDRVVFNEVAGANNVPEQPQGALVDGRQEPTIAAAPVKEEDRVLNGDSAAASNQNSEVGGAATAVAPRAVQTVTVRPDGTLVVNEPAPTTPAAQAEIVPENRPEPAPQPLPDAPIAEMAAAPVAEVPAQNTPVAQSTPPEDAQPQVPVRVVETKPVVQKPKVNVQKAPALDVVPSRPSDQPVNIVNAESAPAPEQPAAQQEIAAAPAPAAGGFAMQIASTPSEESAASTLRSLSGKFGNILGGRDYAIQRAEVEGKGTVYRVRILAGSRAEATQLCARYKSAGGSCFVTR